MQGYQMMRTSVMATHEKHHLDRILELFEEIGTQMGLLEKETPAAAAEQTVNPVRRRSGYQFANILTVTVPTTLADERQRQDADGRPAARRRLEFIRMVWELYKDDPNWVPPLEMDRMRLIDEEKNPFYKHARLQLFLAERERQGGWQDRRDRQRHAQRDSTAIRSASSGSLSRSTIRMWRTRCSTRQQNGSRSRE